MAARVAWDGTVATFNKYKAQLTGHFIQQCAGYLFDETFQKLWLEHKYDCLLYYNTVQGPELNRAQVKIDVELLYGALTSSLTGMAGYDHLLANKKTHDGLSAWIALVNEFDQGGDKELRIEELENIISTKYHRHYKGGLRQFIADYKSAFVELTTLGVTEWKSDQAMKRRIVGNLAPLGYQWLKAISKTNTFNELITTLRQVALTDEVQSMKNAKAKARLTQTNGNNDAKVNLSHIKAPLFKQLPEDFKELIRKIRRQEKEEANSENEPKPNNNPNELPRQYSTANHTVSEEEILNTMETFNEEELAAIDEFIEDEDDESTANVAMVHVAPIEHNDDNIIVHATNPTSDVRLLIDPDFDKKGLFGPTPPSTPPPSNLTPPNKTYTNQNNKVAHCTQSTDLYLHQHLPHQT